MSSTSYEETKKRIQDRVRLVRDFVNKASSMPHMTAEDLLVAKEAADTMEYGEKVLFRSLEKLHEQDPIRTGDIAWAVDSLTSGIMLAVSRSTLSNSALNAAAFKKAEQMRAAKADEAKEIAISQAVEQARSDRDPLERGLASKILKAVNKQLRAAGYEDVSRHVVARRLKNARS